MPLIGEIVKKRRMERKWSLRQLATELSVTPAYVADLEGNRRLPSAELMERLAKVLEVAPEEFAAADVRLSPDLREWIEERPDLISLLRSLRASEGPDMLIQRIARMISRRLKPQPAATRGFIVTWESELRAIAADASAWSIETGGDLFGRWSDTPTILLASRAGPNAKRDHAHFRLDVEYLRGLSQVLATDWQLRYFGDWHSHHRLGLTRPSGGDQKRILNVARRNHFTSMTEIIATMEDGRGDPTIRVHPWLYDLSTDQGGPYPMDVKVLPGLSPVREVFLARKLLPEQELFAWERMPLNRVRIGASAAAPTLEPVREVDATTRELTITHLIQAIKSVSQSVVEHHPTGFGSIVVAKLEHPRYLAFALGAGWPMPVLEVHRLDRDAGSTEVVDAPAGLAALDINGMLDVYRREVAAAGGRH